MTDKAFARNRIKMLRKNLAADEVIEKSRAVFENVIKLEDYINAENVFLYKSINNEVNTEHLFENALKTGKNTAIPKTNGDTMNFYRVDETSELQIGYMGITEPGENEELFDKEEGLIIVPGVAFDRCGNRTGYGKGFYDRYLNTHRGLIRIGIAFDFQIFDEFEAEKHDEKMDIIITESGIVYSNRRICL